MRKRWGKDSVSFGEFDYVYMFREIIVKVARILVLVILFVLSSNYSYSMRMIDDCFMNGLSLYLCAISGDISESNEAKMYIIGVGSALLYINDNYECADEIVVPQNNMSRIDYVNMVIRNMEHIKNLQKMSAPGAVIAATAMGE